VASTVTNTTQKFMRKGELTRAAILDVALDLASRDGLEGLTIGLLADKMNMSKSGVFAHFGSREDLQIEVLKLYHHHFEQEVFYPSMKEVRGLPRLESMFARWIKRVTIEIASAWSWPGRMRCIAACAKPSSWAICATTSIRSRSSTRCTA